MSKKKFLLVSLVGNLVLVGFAPFSQADSATQTALPPQPVAVTLSETLEACNFKYAQVKPGTNQCQDPANNKTQAAYLLAHYFKPGDAEYVTDCGAKAQADLSLELKSLVSPPVASQTALPSDSASDSTDDSDSTIDPSMDVQGALADFKASCPASAVANLKLGMDTQVSEQVIEIINGAPRQVPVYVTYKAMNFDGSGMRLLPHFANQSLAEANATSFDYHPAEDVSTAKISCLNETAMMKYIHDNEPAIKKAMVSKLNAMKAAPNCVLASGSAIAPGAAPQGATEAKQALQFLGVSENNSAPLQNYFNDDQGSGSAIGGIAQ